MSTVTMGSNFPKVLSQEIFNKVNGKSALAKLSKQQPVAFAGTDIFTFALDNDISLVGEGAAKPAGGATVAPVSMKPLKVVYQARVSDEFMYASDEHRIEIARAFTEGFAKKLAKGLDMMALHGVDPKSTVVSTLIGSGKYFDSAVTTTQAVSSASGANNDAVEAAIAKVTGYDCNGIIMGKSFAKGLADETSFEDGLDFTALKWGGSPDSIMGIGCDVNNTVSASVKANADASAAQVDEAIVGDFDAFRWGYARGIEMEVIEFGDPDGAGHDLKQYNEVCLRGEAYIGWAILDGSAFCRITPYVAPVGG